MTYTTLVFLSRKPGTTPEQFRDYYVNNHLPFFHKLVGPHFAVTHTQHYIHRTEKPGGSGSGGVGDNDAATTPRNPTTPATVFMGAQADFDFDVVVTIEHKDAATFQQNCEFFQRPDIAAAIAADEERFLDRSQTRCVLLGETVKMTFE